ncbi:MAG TPA: hypothetical protein VGK02_08575 [Candidatus Aquicultor sp.]|jgi:hypothetical protein
MVNVKRFIAMGAALAIMLYLVTAVLSFGGSPQQAVAGSSEPLVFDGQTVGSVSMSEGGGSISIDFDTDKEFKKTIVTLMGNSGGPRHFSKDGGKHHSYSIPTSDIKGDNVRIMATAEVVLEGTAENPQKKVAISVRLGEAQAPTTCPPATCTTCVPTTVQTPSGGGVITPSTCAPTTVAPTTVTTAIPVTTTVLKVTTTTAPKQTTTTAEVKKRKRLPFTGMDYNWYLIGTMISLAGVGLYLSSMGRKVEQ